MSLDTLNTKKLKIKAVIAGIGYQVFYVKGQNQAHFMVDPDIKEVYENTERGIYPNHKVLAKTKNILTCKFLQGKRKKRLTYKAGFHIWKNKLDAASRLEWMQIMRAGKEGRCVLREVEYSQISAEGLIDDAHVIIAGSIHIRKPRRLDDDFLEDKRKLVFAARMHKGYKG